MRLRATGDGQFARYRATMPPRMPIRFQTGWTLGAATCAVVVASFLVQRGAGAPPTAPRLAATAERARPPARATPPAIGVDGPSAIAAPADELRGVDDRPEVQRPHALTHARL